MAITTVRPAQVPVDADEGWRPRRWTSDEFERAAELGLFRPEERLELLDGEIIEKMTQNEPHAAAVACATRLLLAAFGPEYHVRPQAPHRLDDLSRPEPDLQVLPGTEFSYLPGRPKPADVRLFIEVSDTTLRLDRGRKRAAYARAGITEYWILNLVERQLEVYRRPSRGRYRDEKIYKEGDTVSPLHAPDAVIRVADLLPPVTSVT
jgi:Uma2 family endonuclease